MTNESKMQLIEDNLMNNRFIVTLNNGRKIGVMFTDRPEDKIQFKEDFNFRYVEIQKINDYNLKPTIDKTQIINMNDIKNLEVVSF